MYNYRPANQLSYLFGHLNMEMAEYQVLAQG